MEKGMLVYRNWGDVDQALKELRHIQRDIAKNEDEMNQKINMVRASADKKASPLLDRKKIIESNIESFAGKFKDEFKDSRSKVMLYGTVGFRKSSSIIIRNVKAIIGALKANKMHDCITLTEKIDKEELRKYDDASLEKIGAKRKVEDKFYYNLNSERVDE